jgi:CheY-like chemotaxis protein
LERSAPVILLIEDDEFDRMTLTHMLEESGCSVMASRRGKSAVDTFAIYHRGIALVLASSGLSDVERIRLVEALYRIAPYVPIVIAARRASVDRVWRRNFVQELNKLSQIVSAKDAPIEDERCLFR